MGKIFNQGYFDSLCGIYSIINADKIVNHSSEGDSQLLFNTIIEYLSSKRILKEVLLEGVSHRLMSKLMELTKERFTILIGNRRSFLDLRDWWSYSLDFMEEGTNRAMIISIGGKVDHLSALERITDSSMFLRDSSYGRVLRQSYCKLQGYTKPDKYIIYPSQCWYLGKE